MSSPDSPSSIRRATGIGLVAVLLWSASVGLIRSIAELFGAHGGAALIFSVSGVLVALFRGLPDPRSFNRVYLLAGGALFVAYEICLALAIGLAQNRSQALELGMINYLWPCLTILLAVLAGQQRGSRWLLPGAALSFLGIAWVMGVGAPTEAAGQLWLNLRGNAAAYGLAFAAALLWALYSVLTRRWGGGKSGVSLFLLSTAVLLWIGYACSDEPPLRWQLSGVLQVLLMGASTAVAYSCWNHGIQHGRIALLAVASYFTPVFSVLLASLWLSAPPSAAFWRGVAMVTAGSLLCWWATRRAERA